MRDTGGGAGPAEVEAFGLTRWALLVRTAALLGAPHSVACRLAALAVTGAAQQAGAGGDGRDPDVELAVRLLDAYDDDRTAWWTQSPTDDGRRTREAVATVEPALDRLVPTVRARLVLRVVTGLAPDQVDEAVPPPDGGPGGQDPAAEPAAEPAADPGLVDAVLAAAALVPAAPPSPAALAGLLAQARSSGGAGRSVATVASALVAVVLAVLVVVSALQPGTGEADLGAGASASTGVTGGDAVVGLGGYPSFFPEGIRPAGQAAPDADPDPDPDPDPDVVVVPTAAVDVVPLPWFAGDLVRLGEEVVPLSGVLSLDVVPAGAVATTDDGTVVLLAQGGRRTRLGAVVPGAEAPGAAVPGAEVVASSRSGYVAFIAASGAADPREVTVYDTGEREVVVRVPVGERAEVVAVDGTTTWVVDGGDTLALGRGGEVRSTDAVTVLDAAGGLLALAPSPGEVVLRRDGRRVLRVAGDAVDLSPGGRWALVSDAEGQQLLDVRRGVAVAVVVEAGDTVTATAFADDERLVVVARGQNAPPNPNRIDPDMTPRRSDLLSCALARGVRELACVRHQRLGAAMFGPVLAR